MLEKPNASTTLGLQLEGTQIKGALLTYVKGLPKVEKLFEVEINGENVNPLYKSEHHQDLQKALLVTSLNTHEALIRQLEIKLKKDKDIREVLLFQTEPLLPYPSENAFIDYIKLAPTDEGTLLTIFAARKDHIQQHIEKWKTYQIESEIVTAVPAALANFADFCAPTEHPLYVVHLGLEQVTCVLVQEGKLIAAQSIAQGILQLKNALGSEDDSVINFGDIDISQLTEESHPVLFQAWESIRLEIKRAIFALSKQVKDSSVKELLVTGTGALIPHLASTLANDLEMHQKLPRQESFPNLNVGQLLNFAIPLGEALSAFPKAKNQINFRQEELAYPHPWKRLKSPLLIYASLCLLLAFVSYIAGQSYLKYRQDEIRQSYVELLKAMNKPYEEFEIEFEEKNPEVKPPNGLSLEITQLNEMEIFQRVEYLERDIQSSPDLFPLWPNVPKVSDVLAWLSTQPVFIGKKGKSETSQSFQIESFNYSLVKRPEQNKKLEKYQVKVEIEFTTPTPMQARAFHDALIEPNSFVDPKGEVKWNSSHGRYRTSFYLKDKTYYPTS